MSISSKSNSVAKFNDQKKEFYLNKLIVLGVFLSQRSSWIMPSAKTQLENIDVQFAHVVLSKLPLA